ncbi:MAG: MBL fold metallo-hydrolase [Bdellovibrionota bacterium]|nr:MBL fold metallo-hydrolase [Bdellovibrionota bacterium]
MKLKNFNKLISFGGADTVTGSCHLLKGERLNLLVDAGLFQGGDVKVHKNILSFDPKVIDGIFLTHAHLDHSGLLPLLAKKGFSGPIFCTQATRDIAEVILLDSASLLQKNSDDPLYRTQDVQRVMNLIEVVDFEKEESFKGVNFKFHHAGHIPGAASVSLDEVIFSGDLGRRDDILLKSPSPSGDHRVAIIESTYGAHHHGLAQGDLQELKGLVERIIKSQGTLLIGAFSVARSQMMLSLLNRLMNEFPELEIRIAMDSPMALKVNGLYQKHKTLLKEEVVFSRVVEIKHTWDESTRQKKSHNQANILISSSGMVSGGKILTHLEELAPFKENILFLPGFLSEGTLGRKLSERPEHFLLESREIELHCDVVQGLQYSSHADQSELIDWLQLATRSEALVLVGHGDKEEKEEFLKSIQREVTKNAALLEFGVEIDLGC